MTSINAAFHGIGIARNRVKFIQIFPRMKCYFLDTTKERNSPVFIVLNIMLNYPWKLTLGEGPALCPRTPECSFHAVEISASSDQRRSFVCFPNLIGLHPVTAVESLVDFSQQRAALTFGAQIVSFLIGCKPRASSVIETIGK